MSIFGPSSQPFLTTAPRLRGLTQRAIQADLWLSTSNGKAKRTTTFGSLPWRRWLLILSKLQWSRAARLTTQRNTIIYRSIMSPPLTYIVAILRSSKPCVKSMIQRTSWGTLEVLGFRCHDSRLWSVISAVDVIRFGYGRIGYLVFGYDALGFSVFVCTFITNLWSHACLSIIKRDVRTRPRLPLANGLSLILDAAYDTSYSQFCGYVKSTISKRDTATEPLLNQSNETTIQTISTQLSGQACYLLWGIGKNTMLISPGDSSPRIPSVKMSSVFFSSHWAAEQSIRTIHKYASESQSDVSNSGRARCVYCLEVVHDKDQFILQHPCRQGLLDGCIHRLGANGR